MLYTDIDDLELEKKPTISTRTGNITISISHMLLSNIKFNIFSTFSHQTSSYFYIHKPCERMNFSFYPSEKKNL